MKWAKMQKFVAAVRKWHLMNPDAPSVVFGGSWPGSLLERHAPTQQLNGATVAGHCPRTRTPSSVSMRPS